MAPLLTKTGALVILAFLIKSNHSGLGTGFDPSAGHASVELRPVVVVLVEFVAALLTVVFCAWITEIKVTIVAIEEINLIIIQKKGKKEEKERGEEGGLLYIKEKGVLYNDYFKKGGKGISTVL